MYAKRYLYDAGRKGCLELLENGFSDTFEETLELIEMNEKIKKHADLGLDKEKPKDLSKDFDVMHTMMEMLRKSEEADRIAAIEDSYFARLELANNLLQQSGYFWLAEYLYQSCYRILDKRKEKDEKLKIKTLQLLALLEEQRGNPDVALWYMEKAIKAVKETSLDPEEPLRKELFQQLIRMYHKMGTQCLEKEHEIVGSKQSKAVFYFKRAAYLAKMNDTAESQATSYGLLGRARMKFHDNKRALKRQYMKAHKYFETGYRILLFSGENRPSLLKLCRVMCGVGRANQSFDCLISELREPPEKALNQLLTWRNTGSSFERKDFMETDHLIDLNQEELKDDETNRAAFIQTLIDEEKNAIHENKNIF